MRVHFVQPFAVDKNIGAAYNDACSRADADDWICITDQDSMFLHPFNGRQIYDIVQSTGRSYALLSCVTNRLKSTNQLYNNEFSYNPCISAHVRIAEELYNTRYATVERVGFPVAGIMLLFPKTTWEQFPFAENSYLFDKTFSFDILRAGLPIGLMRGVYRFHSYRFNSPDPTRDEKHLLP